MHGRLRDSGHIARKQGTARPKSKRWIPGSSEPTHGWVLERGFSDVARLVYVPSQPLANDARTVARERKQIRKFLEWVTDGNYTAVTMGVDIVPPLKRWIAREELGVGRLVWYVQNHQQQLVRCR